MDTRQITIENVTGRKLATFSVADRTYIVDDPWCPDKPMKFTISPRRDSYGGMLLTLGRRLAAQRNVSADVVHGGVYLAFLAAKTGELDAVDALSDTGIVHRLVHWLLGMPMVEDDLTTLCEDLHALQIKVERHFEGGVEI